MKKISDALAFATELHAEQLRKGTDIPYVSHLLAVASLIWEAGGDEDEVIAGLLHDGPEDQGGEHTLRLIRRKFGNRVADIVAECSDTFEDPKPPWRHRKEAYIAHLASASRSALLVSSADKLHNARAILLDYRQVGETLWQRFSAGKTGTLWYYRALVEQFRTVSAPSRLIDELDRVVTEIEAITALQV